MSSIVEMMEDHYRNEEYERSLELIEKCVTVNRREGLKATTLEAKEANNNQHAYIRLMEGKLHIAMGNIDSAMQAFTEASSKLQGVSTRKYQLEGQINYNMALIAMGQRNHVDVRKLLIDSTNAYIHAENETMALSNLFEVIDYCSANLPPSSYADYLDNAENLIAKINDKRNQLENEARLQFKRASWMEDMGDSNASDIYLQAARTFDKIGNKTAYVTARMGIARTSLYNSPKQASKQANETLKEAASIGEQIESLIRIQTDLIDAVANKRELPLMMIDQDYKNLVETQYRIQVAGILVEYAKVLILKSVGTADLNRAIEYSTRAFTIYNDAGNKIGTSYAKLMEAIAEIAVGKIDTGLSKKKLSLLNLQNTKKRGDYFNIRGSIAGVSELLLGSERQVGALEEAIQKELAGLLIVHEDKERGLRILLEAEEIFTKIAKKQKEYKPMLQILEERLDHLSS